MITDLRQRWHECMNDHTTSTCQHAPLWTRFWFAVHLHRYFFFSSLWTTVCLVNAWLQTKFPSLHIPTSVLSSKYRQRRLILHLSYRSLTHTVRCAGLMQHFACACRKNSTFASPSQSKTRILNAKLNHRHENLFQTKGASGSLKMDPHPLLMTSLPCLFCSCSMQRGKKRLVQKYFMPVSCLRYCFHTVLHGGGGLPLKCQRRLHLSFELSLT